MGVINQITGWAPSCNLGFKWFNHQGLPKFNAIPVIRQ